MPNLRILLVNTRVPRSTKQLVAGVRSRLEAMPAVMEPMLASMDGLCKTAESVLEKMYALTPDQQQERESLYDDLQVTNNKNNDNKNDDDDERGRRNTVFCFALESDFCCQVLIDMNQHMLNAIGVGHPRLDEVCSPVHEPKMKMGV